jgi:hypothetical protein
MFFAVAILLFCYCDLSYAATINVGSAGAYPTIQSGYNAAGNGDTIQVQAGTYVENDNFNNNISVALIGGYNSTFSTAQPINLSDNSVNTVINGTLTISNGTVNAQNITIQSTPYPICATGAVQIPTEGIGTSLPGGVGIAPYGENHYYITLSNAATEEVSVSTGTRSWINGENLGIMVSNTGQPTCSQIVPHGAYDQNLPPNPPPWYIVGTSTETLFLMQAFPANTTLCVTICNETDISSSLYAIYWGEE